MLDTLFARVYDPLLASAERGLLGRVRAELLRAVAGHVLVVGAGTGADLRHLPADVTQLTLVEPSAPMRARLRQAVPPRLVPRTETIDAFAERLPLLTASVDHVVCSLVLCSVRDPEAVVAEIDRVLRPGGTLIVVEHGAADPGMAAVAQRVANPAWKRIAAGCNLTRDPAALIGARFDVSELHRVDVPPVSRIGAVTAGVVRR
ncbi:MAG: ubiquinone/menaquinone biosynthesis C-methylase UbiE [Myxococcota bacterium]